ncbi:MAG: hypothetical protein JKX69_05465 [Rhodobacteraceae bacterium]|nr:hypothetical protein [Paracoccaceae bacterium]
MSRSARLFASLCILPLVAGCADMPGFAPAEPEPVVLPAAVTAALPAGAPTSVVFQDANGCYLLAIEITDPPSGYLLRGANGRPICPEGASPAVAAPAEMASDETAPDAR